MEPGATAAPQQPSLPPWGLCSGAECSRRKRQRRKEVGGGGSLQAQGGPLRRAGLAGRGGDRVTAAAAGRRASHSGGPPAAPAHVTAHVTATAGSQRVPPLAAPRLRSRRPGGNAGVTSALGRVSCCRHFVPARGFGAVASHFLSPVAAVYQL